MLTIQDDRAVHSVPLSSKLKAIRISGPNGEKEYKLSQIPLVFNITDLDGRFDFKDSNDDLIYCWRLNTSPVKRKYRKRKRSQTSTSEIAHTSTTPQKPSLTSSKPAPGPGLHTPTPSVVNHNSSRMTDKGHHSSHANIIDLGNEEEEIRAPWMTIAQKSLEKLPASDVDTAQYVKPATFSSATFPHIGQVEASRPTEEPFPIPAAQAAAPIGHPAYPQNLGYWPDPGHYER